ncbi:glycerophosphodiester phosphodiesterase [Georgenia yuyongxinii]|uniref:Glycerophosphodiester phosphodiesterase n=1 Tax=Georgenia yuyongxinii TaxID=2589797 RepID=A0A552WLG3_9MICO|nr:glycerophosphodiester phosphodiesterase family protein [Georgenia yuyongxinii]TRW43611.1 glycerophosphodiester phosphodiesterase [Georgenia yuyongxinii]
MTTITNLDRRPDGQRAGSGLPLVVAHRGNSSVAPENTLAALDSAWRAGADVVEVDLQLTKDGVAVVIHDERVDRTTNGAGRADQLTAAQVAGLDAGDWFSDHFRGQQVPTAEDLLAFFVGHPGVCLLAELKGTWGTEDVRRVTEVVERVGLAERTVVQSFDVGTVKALRDVAPELPRGLLVDALPEDLIALCRELRVMALNPSGLLLRREPDLVDALHGEGLRTMVWTLNEPAHWASAVAAGVDGIITDRPDRLRGWLDAAHDLPGGR